MACAERSFLRRAQKKRRNGVPSSSQLPRCVGAPGPLPKAQEHSNLGRPRGMSNERPRVIQAVNSRAAIRQSRSQKRDAKTPRGCRLATISGPHWGHNPMVKSQPIEAVRKANVLRPAQCLGGAPEGRSFSPWRPYSQSSAMSKAGAEWVIAPTLMRSIPVWAMLATVSSRTPPEASRSTRGAS